MRDGWKPLHLREMKGGTLRPGTSNGGGVQAPTTSKVSLERPAAKDQLGSAKSQRTQKQQGVRVVPREQVER